MATIYTNKGWGYFAGKKFLHLLSHRAIQCWLLLGQTKTLKELALNFTIPLEVSSHLFVSAIFPWGLKSSSTWYKEQHVRDLIGTANFWGVCMGMWLFVAVSVRCLTSDIFGSNLITQKLYKNNCRATVKNIQAGGVLRLKQVSTFYGNLAKTMWVKYIKLVPRWITLKFSDFKPLIIHPHCR